MVNVRSNFWSYFFSRSILYFRLWIYVIVIRIRLSANGYSAIKQLPVKAQRNKLNIDPVHLANVIKRVAKFVPGALCLAQAVAGQRQLSKHGFGSKMCVGVKTNPDGQLVAHAWLVFRGRIVLGGSDTEIEKYTVLTESHSVGCR